MKTIKTAALGALIWMGVAAAPALAQQADPAMQVQAMNERLSSEIRRGSTVPHAIRNAFMPRVDILEMSRAVLGRDVWQRASAGQRQHFMSAFQELVVQHLATTFSAVRDPAIKLLPTRGAGNSTRMQIDARLLQRDGPAIALSYRLAHQAGNWKIVDVAVDGVSVTEAFRSQFAATLRAGGLDALIGRMQKPQGGSGGK